MKKSSTNTFNEGLNYDINPNVTPDSVLTDCLNGTFLTFNGDELALQNDAGNTKIQVPGTNPPEYVQLSDGFLPLGIKEHGGVLYIVSAKLPVDTSTQYNEETTYNTGDVVYVDNYEKIYYLSNLNNNDSPLPTESNKWWEVIGDFNDFNNRFGEVEFGSYPSPEASGDIEYDGIERAFSADNLYNKIIINEAFFKTTRYVTFDGGSVGTNGTDYISGYSRDASQVVNYDPVFYKVKLYHQLNSGYLDLTDNIWTKYVQYLENNSTPASGNFWFTDEFFRYYCPSQYKGKLFISVEIEGLEKFELASYPRFNPNGTNYDFELDVLAIGTGAIDVTHARVEIWIDGVKYDFGGGVYYEDTAVDSNTNIATFTLTDIDATYYNKTLRYRVTPVIDVDGTTYTEDDMPEEWIDEFVIDGSRLINTLYDDIDFLFADSYCLAFTTNRRYTEIALTDSAGNYLDNELSPTLGGERFVFLDASIDVPTWESANPNDTVMATYAVVNSKPVILTEYLMPPDIVIGIFEASVVQVEDVAGCAEENLITPFFVGVNSQGIPTILSETGEYKTQSFPLVQISTIADANRISVDYDSVDKLLFVGGRAGSLHIFDLTDQDAIVHKEIKVYADSDDVAGVSIIRKGAAREILVAHGYNRAFKQNYYSNINSYVDYSGAVETGSFSGSQSGYVTNFHYYGGWYWAVSNQYEFFRTQDLATGWQKPDDVAGSAYKIIESSDRLWTLGRSDNERIFYGMKNQLGNSNPHWEEISLSSQYRTEARDGVALKGIDILVLANNTSDGLYRINTDLSSTNIIADMASIYGSCYYNSTSFLYTGGACFDGNKYAYIGMSQNAGYFGYQHKIVKYNAYPDFPETKYPGCVTVPEMYYKLYLY